MQTTVNPKNSNCGSACYTHADPHNHDARYYKKSEIDTLIGDGEVDLSDIKEDISTIQGEVSTLQFNKAEVSTVDALATEILAKADTSDVVTLQNNKVDKVSGKSLIADDLVTKVEEDFIKVDTVAELRALTPSKIQLIANGTVKGIILNGYYVKGDTPLPLDYYLSNTTQVANDIDVIQVGSIKLKHNFLEVVDASYAGIKGDATDETSRMQILIDSFPEILLDKDVYVSALDIKTPTKIIGNGSLYNIANTPSVDITSNDVHLEGIKISSIPGSGESRSISIGRANQGGVAPMTLKNITIKNCIIENTLWYSNIENLRIIENKVNNGSITCWFGTYNRIIISKNIIDNDSTFKGNGINATHTYPTATGAGVRNIIITDNIISCYRMGFEWRDRLTNNTADNHVAGIFANNQIHIKGDTTANEHPFGISLNSGGWLIANNSITKEFRDSRGYGMEIVQSANNTITGNEIRDFNEGIMIYEANRTLNPSALNNIVTNNKIYNCVNNAIRVWRGSSKTTISNNYILIGASSLYGINVEGDQLTADSNLGKKTSICKSVIMTSNIIDFEAEPADTRSKRAINITNGEDIICISNIINVINEDINDTRTFSRIGLYISRSDNVTIRNNTFKGGTVYNTRNQSAGIALETINGRNIKIIENNITNFARDIFQAGSVPIYEVEYTNNVVNNRMFSSTLTDNVKYVQDAFRTKKTTTIPIFGNYGIGDRVYKTDGTSYFYCTTAGTLKTITDITATYTNGTTNATVNKVLGLEVGDLLQIEGSPLPVRIVDIDFNNLILTFNRTVTSSGTNTILGFRAPVFKEITI